MKNLKIYSNTAWKDVKDMKEKIIASYKIIGDFTVKVHHIAQHLQDQGSIWVFTVPGIFDNEYIGTIELEKAKRKALRRLKNKLETVLLLFEEKTEMTRTKRK